MDSTPGLPFWSYDKLCEQLDTAYPGHQRVYWWPTSRVAADTLVVKRDGSAVQCRWHVDPNGVWTLTPLGRTSAECRQRARG